tara:strand:+ start:27 stop:1382 length:1356 start_codon:yes stop_codon:yes gene_type:complete
MIDINKDFAFYSLPTRWWQLSIGAIVFLAYQDRKIKTELKYFSSIFLLISFIASLIYYDSLMLIRVVITFITCILLLYAKNLEKIINERNFLRFFASIGNYSYSLYIVHYPIISFLKYYDFHLNQNNSFYLFSMILILSLAIIGYRIEQNFLFFKINKMNITLTSLLIFTLVFVTFYRTNFLSNTFKYENKFLKTQIIENEAKLCFNTKLDLSLDLILKNCIIGDKNQKTIYLILGDSHAFSLGDAMDKHLKKLGQAGLFFANSSCIPLPGLIIKKRNTKQKSCEEVNSFIFDKLIKDRNWEKIILVGRWNAYFKNSVNQDENIKFYSNNNKTIISFHEKANQLLDYTKSPFYIITQVPELTFNPSVKWFTSFFKKNNLTYPKSKNYFMTRDIVLSSLSELSNINIIDTIGTFCNLNCHFGDMGGIYYNDNDHLSSYGANFLLKNKKIFDD